MLTQRGRYVIILLWLIGDDDIMSIVHNTNKKSGVTYVYDVTSYYRPDKKRCYYKYKLIGKIDPSTGEMVPTGPRGRPRKSPPGENEPKKEAPQAVDRDQLKHLEAENASLRLQVSQQKLALNQIQGILQKLCIPDTGESL